MGVRFFLYRAAKPQLLDQEGSRSKALSFISAGYAFTRFRSSLHLEGYFVLESEHNLREFEDETNAVTYVGELSFKELRRYSEGLNKESKVVFQKGVVVKVREGPYKGLTGVVEDQLGDRLAIRPLLPRGYQGSLVFLRQRSLRKCKERPDTPRFFQMDSPPQKEGRREEKMRNVVLLVDAKYLLYRSHYAYKSLSYESVPTGGLFGFFKTLLAYLEKFEPKKTIIVWDESLEKKREIVPEYKAHREHGEVGKLVQADEVILRDILSSMGFCQAWAQFSEADDVIGHYSRLHGQGCGVVIFSEDKDLLQLTSGRNVYLSSEMTQIRGASYVRQVWGISPEKIPLFRSIRGDKSDNLTGIPRFSTEKLRLLCQSCMTPEDVYAGLEEWRVRYLLSDLLIEKLEEFRSRIQRNYQLMRLDRLWGDLVEIPGAWQEQAFNSFCARFGLDSLVKKRDTLARVFGQSKVLSCG